MRNRKINPPIVILGAAWMAACGGGAAQVEPEGGSSVEAVSPPAAAGPAAQDGRWSFDPAGDPCEALSPEVVAGLVGVDAAEVSEAPGEAARFGSGKRDCKWSVQEAGLQHDIILWVHDRPENAATDKPITGLIEGYLANGEKIGGSEFSHESRTLAGIDGILSEVYGNRYSRERIFSFQNGERQLLRLTLTHTKVEDVELTEPGLGSFEKLLLAMQRD